MQQRIGRREIRKNRIKIIGAKTAPSRELYGRIDFNRAARDPSNPPRFIASHQRGDRLSPRDAGYKAMADPIDLNLFEERD